MKRSGNTASLILAVLCLIVFIIKVIFNALAGAAKGPFPTNIGNMSDVYYLEITPAGWAFSIWSLIYVWNALYIIYALSTTCRDVPPVLDWSFYVLYIVSDVLNVAWLFAFTSSGSSSVIISAVILIANQISLSLILNVVYKNYMKYKKELENDHKKDAYCLQILVQNGVMINTAWVTIASLLSIGMIFVYRLDIAMTISCCIVLAILLLISLIWFALENFKFQDALNYTYLDWPVLLWALSASISKNWHPENDSSRFTVAILVLAVILFIVRITMQVMRNHHAMCSGTSV